MDRQLLERALASKDPTILQLTAKLLENPLFTFTPRPDRPEQFDQQHSFFSEKFPGIACVLSGNGAGKSWCAAAKVARFLAETPPPEKNTPFWVLSQTMDMVTGNCWGQNLAHFIPQAFIESAVWYRQARGLPRTIVLKPHKNGHNYVLEFKSYDQSRQALQAANIVGFWCFVAGTQIETLHGKKNIEEVKINDYVLTTKGYRRVKASQTTGKKEVYQITFSNGKTLVGTADHPVFVMKKGWVKLGELNPNDEVFSLCKLKQLNMAGEYGRDTLMLNLGISEHITDAATTVLESICTEECGKMPTALFRPGITSTIKMEIQTITQSKTSNVCQPQNTGQSTRAAPQHDEHRLTRSDLPQLNGIPPKKDMSGIVNTSKNSGVMSSDKLQHVKNAVLPLNVSSQQEPDFVPVRVETKTRLNEEQFVFNLSVEDTPEYFANEILVHNCDEQLEMAILNEVLGRTRKWNFPGSKIYTCTPLEPDLDLEERFNHPDDYSGWKFYRMNTRLNSAIDPEFVKRIEENEHPGLVQTRLTGAFARYEGMIYPTFGKEHIIEPFPIPKHWLRVRGLDLGWTHATACLWAARDEMGRYYIYREYNQPKTSIEEHVKAINGPGEPPNPEAWEEHPARGSTYADPAAAQVLHEFALRGLHTTPALKDREAGFATVRTLLSPGPDGKPMLQIFNSCTGLIDQLRSYVYDPRTGQPVKESENRLFDLCDSLRYNLFSHLCDGQINYRPIKLPEKPRRKLGF